MPGGKAAEPEDTATTAHVYIPGCTLLEEWISREDEAELLLEVDRGAWEEKNNVQRRVQHYGHVFSYNTLMLDHLKCAPALPPACARVALRLEALTCAGESLQQLTVNEYLPGQGIAAHIDTPHCLGPTIFFLTLSSGVTISLARRLSDSAVKKLLFLPPRSLLRLTGDARYEFSHGIAPRFTDKVDGVVLQRGRRVSLTFRQPLLLGSFPAATLVPLMGPEALEAQAGLSVSDEEQTSTHVSAFLASLPVGSLVLAVGSRSVCDGKSRVRVVSVCACSVDWARLPWRSASLDAALCVNVFNMLSSKVRRVEAVREAVRCVRTGGRLLLHASSMPSAHAFRHGELYDLCSYVPGTRLVACHGEENGSDWFVELERVCVPDLLPGPAGLALPAFERRRP